jgi:hypothetical protein
MHLSVKPTSALKKFVIMLMIATLVLVPMTACKKESATQATTATTTSKDQVVTTAGETTQSEKEVAGYNPINGLPLTDAKAVSARPVAIMVNNIKIATPQAGISSADLIYEIEVEGDITRMMAVFANPADVPEIGSIRSLRHDFIDLAGAFDAIVVHYGGSYAAYDQLLYQSTEHIDSTNAESAFWRDAKWQASRGQEHSVKTDGKHLVKLINSLNLREKNANENRSWFFFQPSKEIVPAAGDSAVKVTSPFSNYAVSTFTYDEATKTYVKGQYNADQIDESTGQPLRFTNVILLQTAVTQFNGDILKEYDLTTGKGYYISGGKSEQITWKKGTTKDPWVFTRAGGQELVLNRGKIYVGILRDTKNINIR